ncbi:TMEM56 [Branchiostoma lanceolatum]|uniref:TMEM56 protein n=1 Tax=Branchiostoma lanceolatum TaxID=7740 RepID=A0A8J9VCA6_BRALA|nr:TMEM56 [Branchiostoma lanceolatum]
MFGPASSLLWFEMEHPAAVHNPGPVLEATNLVTLCGSAVFFLLMFVYVAPAVLRKVFPSTPSYRRTRGSSWTMRKFLSQVHTLIMAPLGWYIYLFTELPPRALFFDHPLVRFGAAIETGYEIVGLFLSLFIPALRLPSFIFHHALVSSMVAIQMIYKCTPHAHNHGFICMTSNLFVNNRVLLNGVGKGKTKFALWNGIALAVVFFCVRIAMLGVEWWHGFHMVMQPGYFQTVPFLVFLVDYPCNFLFTVLNVYWFYKICVIGWKTAFGKAKHD